MDRSAAGKLLELQLRLSFVVRRCLSALLTVHFTAKLHKPSDKSVIFKRVYIQRPLQSTSLRVCLSSLYVPSTPVVDRVLFWDSDGVTTSNQWPCVGSRCHPTLHY